MKTWKIFTVILALLSFCIGIYLWILPKLNSKQSVVFLSKKETQDILNADADHYYSRFNKTDYQVRGVKNKEEYLAKIANSACNVDFEVEEKLEYCIEKLQKLLNNTKETQNIVNGVSLEELMKLPWKIGFTCDKHYENGLPHTRGDTILLNNKDVTTRTIDETCKLLLHEQTHVYQKTKDMKSYLDENFDITNITEEEKTKIPANPDTDGVVYKDKKTGELFQGQYNSQPKHFRDIDFKSGDFQKEHPFEYMAYKMESLID